MALGALFLVGRALDPATREWRVVPLTTYPGAEYTPALSPDGSMLAFSWQGENPDGTALLDLYVMQLVNGAPTRLTIDAGHELYPCWSPDGTLLAYTSGVGDSFAICTVPLLGGPPRELLTVGSPVVGLDWSPQGTHLAYAAHADSSATFRIHVLELSTLSPRVLDVGPALGNDMLPTFSPDGRTLAFLRMLNFNHHEVFLVDIESGEVERLSGIKQRVSGLDWASDHEVVVSASNIVDFDLWLADLESDRRTWLTIPGRPAISPTVARGGDRLVFGALAYECNIWSVDLTGEGEIHESEHPLIASTRLDYHPVCSPDGDGVAFLSDRSGHIEIWIADAGGDDPWRLTEEVGSYLVNPCWSPDSRRIAYSAMPEDRLCVFVSDVGSRIATRLTSADQHEVLLLWSSAGDWLYYRVQRDDTWEVWRRSAGGNREERVTESGYTVFAEAASGADLLGWRDGRPGIWRLPVRGGEATQVVPGEVTKSWTGVALAQDGLFFIRRGSTAACLGFYDWASAREDSLGSVPLDSGLLVLSPDGTRLLYDSTTKIEIDLMLAEVIP